MSESALSLRKNRLKILLLILFSVYLIASQVNAATIYDPNYIWKQIETDHFYIVFNQNETSTANKVASYADKIYEKITTKLKYRPSFKTYIVLTDNTDSVYGQSSSLFERIVISPTLTQAEILGTKYDNYLKMVLTHEFTHMVQMDMYGGPWTIGRILFGKVSSPGVFLPAWLLEGYAIYNESEGNNGGRGHDALFNSVWQSAARENQFLNLSQIESTYYTPWPSGNSPYYFGYPLTKYIIDKYGEATIEAITRIFTTGRSDGKVGGTAFDFAPFDISNFYTTYFGYAIEKATGRSYKNIYSDWQKFARSTLTMESGSDDSKQITSSGAIHYYPKWLNNNAIIYNFADFHKIPSVNSYDLNSGREKELIKYPYIYSDMDVSLDGKIVFSQIKNYKVFYDLCDLYVYDIKSGGKERLTYGKRLTDPSFSHDEKYIVAVENTGSNNSLDIIDIKTKGIETLMAFDHETKISNPSFSSDGKYILASLGFKGTQNIYLIDINTKNMENITKDNYSNINPVFSPDNKYILFASDRNGRNNIFSYEIGTKNIYQITDVKSSALHPSVSKDQKSLTYIGYSVKGFDVHTTSYSPDKWKIFASTSKAEYLQLTAETVSNFNSKPYSSLDSLKPKIWSPNFSADETESKIGAALFGSDVVGLHSYMANILYGSSSNKFSYAIQYINSQLYPDLSLFLFDNNYLRNVQSNTTPYSYWEEEKEVNISLKFPIRAEVFKDYLPSYQYLTGGFKLDRIFTQSTIPGWLPQPAQGSLNSIYLNYMFSDTEKYGFSISPENGKTASLSYQKTAKIFGADFNIDEIVGEGNSYINLPIPNHILALKILGGASRGDILPQGDFALGGSFNQTSNLIAQNYPLRGYLTNSIFGSKMLFANIEYRLPIWYIEDGITMIPTLFKRVSGKIFMDSGDAWTDSGHQIDFKTSVGGEATLNLILLNWVPLELTYGSAYANRDRKWSNYFRVGLGF